MASTDKAKATTTTPVGVGGALPDLASAIESARTKDDTPKIAVTTTPVSASTPNVDQSSTAPNGLAPSNVPVENHTFRTWIIRGAVAVAVLGLLGVGLLATRGSHNKQASLQQQGSVNTDYVATKAPLNDLAPQTGGLTAVNDSSATLTVNGALNINGGLVISSSGTPQHPTKGQVYYNRADNKLYLYNGTTFIDLTADSTGSSNSTVSSVQGQTGAVSFTGGTGIAISGTTISSTGVTSLVAGSSNLSITPNGGGSYTITDSGNASSGVLLQATTPGAAQTGNINITGTMIAGTFQGAFQGDGSAVSNLNASNIGSGTLADARLSANVTVQGNTFNVANKLVQLDGTGNLAAFNGSLLTNLNASNISAGTLADARLSTNVTVQGNAFNGASQLVKLDGSGLLPALNASNLTNLNVSNATAGTLPDARLSTNVTVQGNSFNNANQLVQLTGLGYLPALNGSNLTNLNASNISSGTLADARLSTNVALLNANQTFTGANTFSQAITVNTITPSAALTVGATGQSFTLQGSGSSVITSTNSGFTTTVGFAGTPVGNVNYNFDNSIPAGTYNICTTRGNCAGSGSGVTTLGGTVNKLAVFTGTQTIGNSSISDNGTTVTIQNASDSGNAFQIQNNTGTSNLFVADTSNTRIGIGTATPGYTLDVNGDINAATDIRVGGVVVCTSTGCNASSSSGFYVQNSTALQTGANFNIQSVSSSAVGGVIKGASGQSADLFQLQQGSTVVAKFDASGNIDITGVYKVNGSQIASTNLSDTANIARLNANQTLTGNNTFTGTLKQQNAVDSTAAFQIQNALGTSNLFIADTSNTRIGIGTAIPGYTLDVNGDINIASGSLYRINGTPICGQVTATCAPAAGSASYIQNTTTQQTGANFNIQSNNGGAVGGIIRGKSTGQSADLLQLQDAGGNNVATFGNEGLLSLGQTGAATGAVAFTNTAGSGTITLTTANPGASSYTLTLPAETGTLCSTGSICAGYAATGGTSQAFVQGGNTMGASTPANLGTNDSNVLNFRTNGTTRLTLDTTGANLSFAQASTIGGITNAGGAGYSITLQGGTGTTSGGDVKVIGGSATNASTNGNNVLIYGGTAGSGGVSGSVNIGTSTAGAAGTTNIESATGTINIGTAASTAHAINIATTSNAIQTLNLGSQYSTSATTLQGGSAGVTVQTAVSTTSFQVKNTSGNSLLTVDSSNNNVSVGQAGVAGTIQIGNTTGAATQYINIGTNTGGTNTIDIGTSNALATTSVSIQGSTVAVVGSGSTTIGSVSVSPTTTIASASTVSLIAAPAGTVSLGTTYDSNIAIANTATTLTGTIIIGSTTQTGTITLGQSTQTQTISIGSNNIAAAKTQTINIGNGAGAGTAINVNILSGISTAGSSSLKMANNTRVTTIDLGNVAPSAARTTTIGGGNSAVTDTINIGTGNTLASKVIHIADGIPAAGAANTVSIGSTSGASSVTLQGGSGFGVFTRATSSVGFSVQDSTGANKYLTVNTSAGIVEVGSSTCSGTVLKFCVNTPAAVDNTASALITAGSTTSKPLVIQGVSGQSANLQEWQSSSGNTVLASISAGGNLTAKAATFTGTLTVNGHIISGNTSGSTTFAVNANAGTGGTITGSAGNDTAGVITINTGTGTAAGIQATVTFSAAYGAAPAVVITPGTVPGGGIFPQFQYNSATGSFDLKSYNALTASSTYTFTYHVIQ
jgi:hypothetical protein